MKSTVKHYSEEQIKSIRENLQRAFGIDYLPVNTQIKHLYKDKKFIPLVDDIMFVYLPYGNEHFNLKEGWYRIKVTYVRSGVMFFKYIDTKKKNEDHADLVSTFVENAYMGTIRMKDVAIAEQNYPLVKFEKGNAPFDVEVFDKEGNKLENVVVC